MKNFLILGLLALLLFSISAAASLWLNQSKNAAAEKEKDKDKEKAKEKDKDGEKAGAKVAKESPPAPKPDAPGPGPDSAALIRAQEAQMSRRAQQFEMVIRDLQTQREASEASLRLVMAELKNVSAETSKLDLLANSLKAQQLQIDQGEVKNIEKLATMYDAMAPESAAPLLKEMAEKGRLDTAAKIVLKMKERNVARVLESMNDPALAFQILDRVRTLRPPAPVVPAKGP